MPEPANEIPPSPEFDPNQTVEFGNSLPTIPGFQLDCHIGAGGMGDVYRGVQISTGRVVAVKVIRPSILNRSTGMQTFVREASIAIRLKHPNIVETIDFGLQDNLPYLVMECLDCVDLLATLLQSSPAHRMRMAAAVTSRILAALQYAHELQFVHRDIKPANVLAFKREGKLQIKLSDFGLAKNFDSAGETNLSLSNEVKGTFAYMSPEQIRDCRYAKPACDIYSAGACLYEFLAGRPPFAFDNISSGIANVLNGNLPTLRGSLPWIQPGLEAIVNKAMANSPGQRFASALEMQQALEKFTKRTTYEV